MRSSLVVSILEQLCADGDADVRLSSLNSCMKVLEADPGMDRYRVVSLIASSSGSVLCPTNRSDRIVCNSGILHIVPGAAAQPVIGCYG